MPKEEWGVKRLCPNCSTRFYDLQQDPMTCPLCGHIVDLETLLNPKGRAAITKKDDDTPETDVTDDIDDTDVLDDDDSDVDLGDDLLEEDDDDTVSIEEIADVPTNDDES